MQDKAVHKALAKRMQLALQYALEREQWSNGVQQENSHHKSIELERLRAQLAEARAERDKACGSLNAVSAQRDSAKQELEGLRTELAGARLRLGELCQQVDQAAEARAKDDAAPAAGARSPFMTRTAAVAVSLFAVATLFTSVAFHDAQSNVKAKRQSQVAVSALEAAEVVATAQAADDKSKPPPQTEKGKTRFVRAGSLSQKQWGPALLMADPGAARPHVVFDPLIKDQQQNLLTLGFDLGEADGFNGLRTRQAIEEFRALYLPESAQRMKPEDLAVVIRNYANLVRGDAARFGIDTGVVAAIRLSSVRTGVDFSYLMKLAATESNFQPTSQSSTSSATGMYQFTHDTWLFSLKEHGHRYGLGAYADEIEFYVTRGGYQRPMVRDKKLYEHLLDLRNNPRVSAMMAAESVRDNQRRLVYSFDREPAQADLYLTHFLGADGAITFLRALEQSPEAFAVDIFPEAARSNHGIFHPQTCDPRTVDEVYELFGEKFSTQRYDDLAAN